MIAPFPLQIIFTLLHMEYRCIVLGDKQVGQTSFIRRFIEGKFPEECEVTIEDTAYTRKITMPGEEPFSVKVIDVAYTGNETNMRSLGQAYILIFDLTERKTFQELPKYVERIRNANNLSSSAKFPFVVVGNKVDVVNFKKNSREVKKSEAISFVKSNGGSKNCYFECSPKESINVDEPFQSAVKALWENLEIAVGAKGEKCSIQ